jgi:hypothetical protein
MPRTKKKKSKAIDSELAKWRKREQERHAGTLARLRDDIIPTLVRMGVAKVQVECSGYGDSGAINSIDYFNSKGKAITIDSSAPTLDAEIECVADEFLPAGFEINEGGQGDITIDVAKGCLTIEHQENYVETTDNTQEFSF